MLSKLESAQDELSDTDGSPWAPFCQAVPALNNVLGRVNTWLWRFGRGRERLGGLSVSETEDRREQVVSAGAKRGAKTRRRREAARRGDK